MDAASDKLKTVKDNWLQWALWKKVGRKVSHGLLKWNHSVCCNPLKTWLENLKSNLCLEGSFFLFKSENIVYMSYLPDLASWKTDSGHPYFVLVWMWGMQIYIFVWVHMHVGVFMFTHVCRAVVNTWGLSLSFSTLYFFIQNLSVNLNFIGWANLISQ